MEFIRNKLDHLASFLQSQQAKLDHYLKTFPQTQSEAVEATDRFIQDINEVITYIASSISQSCKNGSSSDAAKDRLQYSPDQVSKVCKIKAKMQQIRYAFLCPSSERSTEIADIQVLFEEALQLCSNQLVYTHFKGATKGRYFDIDGPQRPNIIEKQEQGEGSKVARLKMKDSKRILYEEVSRHLHAEQQKKRKQEQSRAISPIKPHNISSTANVHLQSRQKIFSGQEKREEQRLRDQAKCVIASSDSSKTSKQANSVSTHQASKSIERARTQRQQQPVEVTEFQVDQGEDSTPPTSKQAQLPHESNPRTSTDPPSFIITRI